MIVLVIGLGSAVAYEVIRRGGDCWQTSISGYYYTNARAVFVATLTAIGVCLICLRGSTELEDVLLNVAGMFAPVVAFVPTPNAGPCATLLSGAGDPTPVIRNNVGALLIMGLVTFVILAMLSWRRRQPTVSRLGYGLAVAIWVGAAGVLLTSPATFVEHAHNIAAFAMFGGIILVAWVNALGFRRKQGDPNARNRYSAVAAAMLGALVLLAVGGTYRVLLAELAAIVLFAIFWAIQTEELWGEGVR